MSKKPAKLLTAFRHYEVGDQLGEGGSGVVYLVRDNDGQRSAVKLVRAGLNADRRQRFKNELLFCSRQSHPNIVRVVDWGVDDGDAPFYVMPYYESNVRKAIDAGIAPEKVVPLFTRIVDGVEAAHLQSVIHRDLKPENILCTVNLAELVIADFGIARFEEEDLYTAVETRQADRLANFKYAAPEQKERGVVVDHRADIFALGLILNELFTKQVIQGAGYRKIGDVVGAFGYLDPIVEKMVQQNPEARPASMKEVKEALIRAGVQAVSLQRLSQISDTVVPDDEIDSRHSKEQIAVQAAEWHNGRLLLTLTYQPEHPWVDAFHRIGNFTSLMGKGPARWTFQGNVASIDAWENEAQQCIDHFKSYIPNADRALREGMENAARRRKHEIEERLRREHEAEELRLRVNKNLRV